MTDFPTIDPDAVPVTALAEQPGKLDLTKIDLTDVALAQFGPWRADVESVRQKLDGVRDKATIDKKLAEAKSLRHRLIGTPLAEARKVSTALKSKLTAVSKAVGTELADIETAYEGAAKLITPQIEAREAEIAEEKRIAAEKEATRVEKHKTNLAKLAGYVEQARGLPSSRIRAGVDMVSAIVIDRDAWEEFADRAEDQKAVTLERMKALLANAEAAEAEERRRAEEKAEQERKAEQEKAQRDRLAAERAELERARAEIEAARAAAAAEAQAKADEAARLERQQREDAEAKAREEAAAQARAAAADAEADTEFQRRRNAATVGHPDYEPLPVASIAQAVADQSRTAPAPEVRAFPAPAAEAPTMTLGALNARLGFTVSGDFLESLGFVAHREKAARLYRPSQFPAICAGISAHVLAVGAEQKKAA